MSGSTSIPAPSFTATGFVAPAESAILAGAQADINAAFGGTLNPALTTPQGQLATSESAILGDVNSTFLALANGVDPAYATGRMQDAIGRIYFMTREPATPTTISVVCTGLNGVGISVGSLLQAEDGNNYICTQAGTIPLSGSVTLPFECVTAGTIACPAQTFTIYQTVPGWDSAVSSSEGVLGTLVESRSAFEARRQASVANNSIGALSSIRSTVLAVPGVTDCYVTENATAIASMVGGVTIAPYSVYVCANGGTSAAVAQAIWTKKPPGCAYTGNTTVTVTDSNSGYLPPQPTYSVSFQIPTLLPIMFAVSIANSPLVPSNALVLIQAAMINAFGGGDGGQRSTIGATIYASRFYATIAALGTWANVVSVLIGTSTPTSSTVSVGIGVMPTISASNITLTLV
jgi:hypothetical protein